MYNMVNIINTAVRYGEQILSSHHKEKYFFYFFNFVSVRDDGYSLNLLWSSFHNVCKSKCYALNLYSAVCQLYLNKTGRTKIEK